jgi:hypothetical protein
MNDYNYDSNWCSVVTTPGKVNVSTFYGVQVIHECLGNSHNIGFRGTLDTSLEQGVIYEINIPTWCDTVNEYGIPASSISLHNNYFAIVEIFKDKMTIQPFTNIPSGAWLCGTCVLINYPT